jgi:hypothetical protein
MERVKASINAAIDNSEPTLVATARLISDSVSALLINQGIDQVKTAIANTGHEYTPLVNAVLELAIGPATQAGQKSVPEFAEAPVKVTLEVSRALAHKSVDLSDSLINCISL